MAKNSSEGPDKLAPEKEVVQGFWGNRTQFQNPETGQWAKRDKVALLRSRTVST